jgi:hypothetical protein
MPSGPGQGPGVRSTRSQAVTSSGTACCKRCINELAEWGKVTVLILWIRNLDALDFMFFIEHKYGLKT